MKHFLTYLLLLIMAVYAVPHVPATEDAAIVLLEKEKESKSKTNEKEEKQEKEVLPLSMSLSWPALNATYFIAFAHELLPSPAPDITLPPPDHC